MQKFEPCIWFNDDVEEAVSLYLSCFPNSRKLYTVPTPKSVAAVNGRPEGSILTIEFELAGMRFCALNGGHDIRPNQSLSFLVRCNSAEEADRLWKKLAHDVHIPLAKQPYSEKYGWCEDKFGVNWQIMLVPGAKQKISPAFLFSGKKIGQCDEAVRFYTSTFPGSELREMHKDPEKNTVLYSEFSLHGQDFVAMEGPTENDADFSYGVSLMIQVDDQKELDAFWSNLSAVKDAEQCGWIVDKFGVSWQLVHKDWGKMLGEADERRRERLMDAIMAMKKPDLAKLEAAARG